MGVYFHVVIRVFSDAIMHTTAPRPLCPLTRRRHRARQPLGWLVLLGVLLVAWAPSGIAQPDAGIEVTPQPVVTQPVYPVDQFSINFDRDVSSAGVTDQKLLNQPLRLSKVGEIYTEPQDGVPVIVTTLADLKSEKAQKYDATALRAIVQDLLAYLNDEAELYAMFVLPDPRDIGLDLSDRREGRTALRILIRVGSVGRVRTLASGDRIAEADRENNPKHQRILDYSPLKSGETPRTGTLVDRGELDDYLYRLNRHPGRRVDSVISAGTQVGEVQLDYMVSENKPWYVYFQLSNTGTESTNELRERFGFVHNQLTNNDDTLALDYVTAGFDQSHVVNISYTRPLGERFEVRVHGLWSNFTADQVGSTLDFIGEDAAAGLTLAHNVMQRGPWFVDLVGGLEYYFTSAENETAGLDGAQNLLLGTAGFEFERVGDLAQVRGELLMRGSLNQAAADEFAALGRTAPSRRFAFVQYGVTTSLYLEPLLNRAAWEDIADPSSSTLAHELALSARGQWALSNDRLVPTFQAVAGGLYSVRGYDQAEVAGDSSMILSAEYRFHVPRVFGIKPPKQTRLFDRPFRVAPESVYGRPDWDFVLKAFFDYGFVENNEKLAFESDETLMSTGVGFEVSLKNNVSFRGEWGFALQDGRTTEAGDSRFHFVLTLLY